MPKTIMPNSGEIVKAIALTAGTTDLTEEFYNGLYKGSTGDVAIEFEASAGPVTFKDVQVGTIIRGRIKRVTSGTNLVALNIE